MMQTISRSGLAPLAWSAAAIVLCAVIATPARAQLVQPNGLVVPTDPDNDEIKLPTLFEARGEPLDYVTDARTAPETFSPLCDFTATLLLREADQFRGLGWYNAVPGSATPPPASQIYEIVPATAAVETTITGADIRADPRYTGGLVGFALKQTPPHYTERRFNTLCNSGACTSSPGPWILAVVYASVRTPNAWYLAFEDGPTSASSWSNDGDYNDAVFFITGLSCPGGGEPCEVEGREGVCGAGLTQCRTGGELSCESVAEPSDERCDAFDNDCDGSTDEGDLCDETEVCFRGRCEGRCGEFGCLDPTDECLPLEGICVDAECVGMECEDGYVCEEGECVTPCDGVRCPGDQICRVGRCVDACEGVTCGEMQVCDAGVCVFACSCAGCAAGLACGEAGRCEDPGCVGMSCDVGEECVGSLCVPICNDDVVCPGAQVCEGGECVDPPPPTTDDGGVGDGGADDGGAGDGGAEDGGPRGRPSGRDDGCGCALYAPDGRAAGPWAALLLGLVVFARRRRRGSARRIG